MPSSRLETIRGIQSEPIARRTINLRGHETSCALRRLVDQNPFIVAYRGD